VYKIIYDLDQAVRLEKKGDINAAADRKQNAAKIAEPFNSTLAKLAQDKNRDAIAAQGHKADFLAKTEATAASERSSNFAARLRLQGDQLHAAASAANAAAARESNNFNKAQTAYQLAQNARSMVDKEYDTVVNKDAYMKAKADVRDLSNSKVPEIITRVEDSRKYIEAVEKDFKARREMMDKSVKIAENRLNSISGGAAIPTTTPTTDNAVPTTMTRAQVESVAKERNKTVAEVEAAAKAKGITIN
jgi:hypothetical protein